MKIALSNQKRLMGIFLLAIVLPSVALSLFGLRAIRNEKYRRDRQIMTEHQSTMALMKAQFVGRLRPIESVLQNTAQHPSIQDQDFPSIKETLKPLLNGIIPAEQFFIVFRNGNTFFPLLEPFPGDLKDPESGMTDSRQTQLNQAQEAEYKNRDYRTAISLYRNIYNQTEVKNTKAQMLSHIARNQKKLGQYASAVQSYKQIIQRFPGSISSSRLSLALSAEMQIVDCDRKLGKKEALTRALEIYEKLSNGIWPINEDQYHLYADMINETITEILKEYSLKDTTTDWNNRVSKIQEKHQKQPKQWQIRSSIEDKIVPELRRMLSIPIQRQNDPVYLSRIVEDEDYLISAVPIPSHTTEERSVLLGMKWNNEGLVHDLLRPVIHDLHLNEETKIRIVDNSGDVLLGDPESTADVLTVSNEFDDSFPPWNIEIYRPGTGVSEATTIFKSYYFWTILVMLMILIFGAVLIIRIMAREREVMRLKSDFVSSVSHELKTPLTSIKALTERLLEGKVKSPAKMKQYFSVIAQDTDKLTRLVKNSLDFSRIEEGKKEYQFEETDVVSWLDETINHFREERSHDRIQIEAHLNRDIPSIMMDRDEMTQCMNNLLDNAIKFSQESKKVEVILEKSGAFVMIRVRNQGIGVRSDELDRIFEKFYQGSNVSRHSVKGTGLGLTLVKHAVEAHRGHIEVESQAGQGTTFSIFLPLSKQKY